MMSTRVVVGADWNDDRGEEQWARRLWEGSSANEHSDRDDPEDYTEELRWWALLRESRVRRARICRG